MKIVIAGGSGQVGRLLARAFAEREDEVVVLSRSPGVPQSRVRTVPWDSAAAHGAWQAEIDGADVVVNLAGRSVNCRYTARNRAEIMNSRLTPTRAIGAAIARAQRPPRIWLQASTATIYAHRFAAPNDEGTGIIGGSEPDAPDAWRFSIEVATAWERAADDAPTPATRKVALRSAMVMSPDRGGIFDTLLRLVRWRLGGRAGSGRQYVSWIHHRDFLRAIDWLIAHDEVAGAVNLAAPAPLPYADFMRALRQAWGVRVGLPSAGWMLAIAALVLRTETELVLKSRRVVPGRLLLGGFAFDLPDWPAAARDLCAAWRQGRDRTARVPPALSA